MLQLDSTNGLELGTPLYSKNSAHVQLPRPQGDRDTAAWASIEPILICLSLTVFRLKRGGSTQARPSAETSAVFRLGNKSRDYTLVPRCSGYMMTERLDQTSDSDRWRIPRPAFDPIFLQCMAPSLQVIDASNPWRPQHRTGPHGCSAAKNRRQISIFFWIINRSNS